MASWMYGFCEALRTSNLYDSSASTCTGVSGGAINAVCLAADVSVAPEAKFITTVKQTLRRRNSNMILAIREGLNETLPDDVATRISGRTTIAVVEADFSPSGSRKPLLVDQFESKEDVIGAVCASCHLPFLMDRHATASWRGKRYLDAAVFGHGIIHVHDAVHVSICPPIGYTEGFDPGDRPPAGLATMQSWIHETENAPSDAHPWLAPPAPGRTPLPSGLLSVAMDVFGVRACKGAGQERYELGQQAFRVWCARQQVVDAAML